MARTLKELAQEAMDVQDACNLLAVVNGMARAIKEMRDAVIVDWGEVDNHPIVRLWADKIAHLTGTQAKNAMVLADAYGEIRKILTGDES